LEECRDILLERGLVALGKHQVLSALGEDLLRQRALRQEGVHRHQDAVRILAGQQLGYYLENRQPIRLQAGVRC
jgi:hypothetical protein